MINTTIFVLSLTLNSSDVSILNSTKRMNKCYPINNCLTINHLGNSISKSSKPTQLNANTKLLEDIKKFEFNWNGSNGREFDSNFINSLMNKLNSLNKQPSIYPTGRESIQFEYYFNENILELEISKDFKCDYFIDKNGLTKEGIIDFEEINGLVNEFYKQ